MMLRGAGYRDHRQFLNDLENLGVQSGEAVGTTHASFGAATLADHLEPALDIYADLVRRPHLPAEMLEDSRRVVLQELRGIEDEPAHRVMLELRRRQYPDPWGRSSTGERAAVESISIDDIRGHYQQCYGPNETILAAAGRFEWERLVDRVGGLLGDWAPAERPEPTTREALARHEHVDYPSSQTQIGISYPCIPQRHEDYFLAWAAVEALSGGMSSRFFTEVRERRGLCYSVYAYIHSLRDRGAVMCYAGTSADRAQETLDVMVAELDRLTAGIEPAELDRIKARSKSSLIMQQESSRARSAALARDWHLLGRPREMQEISDSVDRLTCERINAFLAANPPRDFVVVTLGPNALEVPARVL
jgi:predicted Zn-dependent peptidase